jgi:L-threonylcarbamoyladenylate synthase
VPDEVTAGLDTVAVRVPSHPVAQALLRAARIPIAAPSANLFSRPSPTRADHVLEDLSGRIDLILDAGPTDVGIESTVLDLSGDVPTVLRPGAVTTEMLGELLSTVEAPSARPSSGPMRSPGLLSKHYAPRAPLTLYEGMREDVLARVIADARSALGRSERVGLILATGDENRLGEALEGGSRLHVCTVGTEQDAGSVASRLYAAMRELDGARVDIILARSFPSDTGLGVAIQDRLRRAAAGRIIRC